MSPELRRGAAFSAALHIVAGIALLVVITPSLPPEAPQQLAVTMEFAPAPSGPAAKPSPKKPVATPTPPAVKPANKPKPPTPVVRAPAPPPPPPPSARVVAEQAPIPPKAKRPPPPLAPSPKPTPAPTTPAPPKPQAKPRPHPARKPLPLPPPPAPPPPKSATNQPHVTKNPVPSSRTLENTLEKLRALEQKKARLAEATPAPAAASAADSPGAGDTKALNAAERGRIGAYVRRCWTYDPGAKGVSHFQVLLEVVTDAAGTVRIANVAPADQARIDANPELRAFAGRAINAILDPRCATLPLPAALLGAPRRLVFRFTP